MTKLHENQKPCVFGVATGFLPHIMALEGGGEAETPVRNLMDIFFATRLIESINETK